MNTPFQKLPRGTKLRALVVDDDEAMRRAYRDILKECGFERVHEARSAEEAEGHLSASRFDIVLTDLEMGRGMSGYDLILRMRMNEDPTPAILSTGLPAAALYARHPGARDIRVLHKPASLETLMNAVFEEIARFNQEAVRTA